MTKVFILNKSENSRGHIDFVEHQVGAVNIPYEKQDDLYGQIIGIESFDLPKQLYFGADYKIIPTIDYPANSLLIDIMSNQMLTILSGTGEFKFRTIPVIMFNHKELEAYHIEEGIGFEDLNERNEDYLAFQLMDFTAAFDKDNSVYRMSRAFPDEIGSIQKLVLKEPINGFPPIFKIEEDVTLLFITEEAKTALETAGIKGCEFVEVEVSR
ncbi:hypothetical protein ABGT15_04855 [Flavobacterium enshiense]|uniref:hypothetical protein n=1 Tax=Flavobacterium enshiense TaxID=1341165 RepID=UPI00345DEC3A